MEEKDIDKIFRTEKMSESYDPPSFVWDELEKDLRSSKRKKRFIAWWFLGLFIVASTTIYLLENRSVQKIEESLISQPSTSESDSHADHLKSANLNQNKNKEQIANDKTAINGETPESEVANVISSQSHTKTAEVENSALKYQEVENQISQTLGAESNIDITTSAEQSEPIAYTKTESVDNANFNQNPKDNVILAENGAVRKKLVVSSIDSKSFLLVASSKRINAGDVKSPRQIESDRKLNGILVSLHLGKPTFSDFSSTSSTLSTTVDWYTFGLGINYCYEVANKFRVGAGLRLQQSKRKFNYTSEELLLRNYETGSSFQSEFFEYGKLISQGEQRFTFFDITAGMQYEIWSGGLEVSLGLSANFNLILDSEGKTLGESNEIIHYSNEDKIYPSKLGLGFSPYVSLCLPIRENLSVTLIPSYTKYFKKLESERLSNELRYSNFGLDIGMSKQF